MMEMEERIAKLHKTLPYFEEEVIGCCLLNYGTTMCGAFRSYGCKNAARCKNIMNTEMRGKHETAT